MKRSFATLALVILCSCSDLSPSDELTAARERWKEWGSASYDLTVSRMCECLFPIMTGPVLVRVRNAAVESRTYLDDGQPVDFSEAALYPDVNGLFALVESAIQDGVLGEVEYDPVSGHPRRVFLDYDGPNGADGEFEITAALRVP